MDLNRIGLWSMRVGFIGTVVSCAVFIIAALVLPFYGIHLINWGDVIVFFFSASLNAVSLGGFVMLSNNKRS